MSDDGWRERTGRERSECLRSAQDEEGRDR